MLLWRLLTHCESVCGVKSETLTVSSHAVIKVKKKQKKNIQTI